MSSRICLKKNDRVLVKKAGAGAKPELFVIDKKIGEGGSAVCYEAFSGKMRGRLKEFYPWDDNIYMTERKSIKTSDGESVKQLVPAEGIFQAYKDFEKAAEEYIEPYGTLLNEIMINEKNTVLNTFIPHFEIYYGCDEKGERCGSVYVWTPSVPMETFDTICGQIRKKPGKNPEHSLFVILNAIKNLTECICMLHCAELLHGDIKPSNFGFLKRNGKILTEAVSLFDVNSIYSVYKAQEMSLITEGFTAPEMGKIKPNNRADIYSIGATLFSAIIINHESEAGIYCDEYYDRIEHLVDTSELIAASDTNSHPYLRSKLAHILKMSLNKDRNKRYAACEELIEDIDDAIKYLLPGEYSKKLGSGKKFVLVDVEQILDKKNPTGAFQKLLYTHPLYEKEKNGEINVLVMGFGVYAQKFLDLCLQAGQMPGRSLNVTVVSKDKRADKEVYLKDRSCLDKFFDVDGSLENSSEESYGKIRFVSGTFENGKAVPEEIIKQSRAQYVFIALGDDKLNHDVAKACEDIKKKMNEDYSVHFAWEGKPFAKNGRVKGNPVYVFEEIEKGEEYSSLERMAFNAHLIWETGLNLDYKEVRRKFEEKYNYDSCVSNVLSVKYKLYSVGIDIDKLGANLAAEMFKENVWNSRDKKDIKNELIACEHRRWVTEKLCKGWKTKTDYDDCVFGETNDKRKKEHVCIVRGGIEQKLASPEFKRNNCEKWDKLTNAEIEKLDELDQVSVKLHKAYVKKAGEIRNKNILSGEMVQSVEAMVKPYKEASVAFNEWHSCMRGVWHNDKGKVRMYEACRIHFEKTLNELPGEVARAVKLQMNALHNLFKPILKSTEYKNFKQLDVDMVKYIPFILTYSEHQRIAMPIATEGTNTELFNNVAAALVINPEKITYMHHMEEGKEIIALHEALVSAIRCLDSKNIKSGIEVLLSYNQNNMQLDSKEATDCLKAISKRVRRVVFCPVDSARGCVTFFNQEIKNECPVEMNGTRLSNFLNGACFYDDKDTYSFDSACMKFKSVRGCERFGYIKSSVFAEVRDIASFKNSEGKSESTEFFNDYRVLWELYSKNNKVWKSMCNLLGEHAEKNDVIAFFNEKADNNRSNVFNQYRYIMPFACGGAIGKILARLKVEGVVHNDSDVHYYTTDSCELVVKENSNCKVLFDRLAANPYALMSEESILVVKRNRKIEIIFDSLVAGGIKKANFPAYEGQYNQICSLLKELESRGYISALKFDSEGFDFVFATLQIKRLLTCAGRILEIYTYHKVKESGRFDDVVSGYTLSVKDTDIMNEFDCILTKGFKMLFVECKATANIVQDYYFKLAWLAHQFGVNAQAVLVADTRENPRIDNMANTMQRMRGNEYDIVTVSDIKEIENIGEILSDIMDGKYNSQSDKMLI